MNKEELKAFLSLLLLSDPHPVTDKESEMLVNYANEQSIKLGFSDWTDALHNL